MRFIRGLLLVACFLAIFVTVSLFFLGDMIRSGLEKTGPALLGVTVDVQGVSVSPLAGTTRITGISLGNPQGYREPASIKLTSLQADLEPQSLFSSPTVIRSIVVDGLVLTWEDNRKGVNLLEIQQRIMDMLEKQKSVVDQESGSPPAGDTSTPDTGSNQARLRIDQLTFRGGQLRLVTSLLSGRVITLTLPDLILTGIGQKENGVLAGEALRQVLKALLSSCERVIHQDGGLPEVIKAKTRNLLRNVTENSRDVIRKGREELQDAAGKLRDGWRNLRERIKK